MSIVFYAIFVLLCPVCLYKSLLLYQLSGYRLNEFFITFKRKKATSVLVGELLSIILFVFASMFSGETVVVQVISGISVGGSVISGLAEMIKAKVKLRITARLLRLCTAVSAFSALVLSVTFVYSPVVALAPLVAFVGLLSLHLPMSILEKKHSLRFIASAQTKLDGKYVIAITGSYGKTSTKNILKSMLGNTVCVSRGNYNTPLGIARSVNEDLFDEEIYVAEFGARYTGDIKQLCELYRPQVALVTAIGNQHLETFGSRENIAAEKLYLAEFVLNRGGIAILNCDDERIKGYVESTENSFGKKLTSGSSERGNFDASYRLVRRDEYGTRFIMNLQGEEVEVSTKLLSGYAPSLITMCALAAYRIGIKPEQIKNAISALVPLAHRQELLYNGNDVIIDDSYNANESGAKDALGVLASFSNRVRVVITPGLVELGKEQAFANERLGKLCAESADYAIFVGSNADFLLRGARLGGMIDDRIFVATSLADAVDKLKIIQGERAILFMNDLPDNY